MALALDWKELFAIFCVAEMLWSDDGLLDVPEQLVG
jgi:hypothetical protein